MSQESLVALSWHGCAPVRARVLELAARLGERLGVGQVGEGFPVRVGVDIETVGHTGAFRDAAGLFQQVAHGDPLSVVGIGEGELRQIGAHRFVEVAAGEAQAQPIRAILLRCIPDLWPLDGARRGEYRVSKAFHARALDVPTVAEVARETAAGVRGQIARAVENGKECGEVEPQTNAENAALELSALIAGLADALYPEPLGPNAIERSAARRPSSKPASTHTSPENATTTTANIRIDGKLDQAWPHPGSS